MSGPFRVTLKCRCCGGSQRIYSNGVLAIGWSRAYVCEQCQPRQPANAPLRVTDESGPTDEQPTDERQAA